MRTRACDCACAKHVGDRYETCAACDAACVCGAVVNEVPAAIERFELTDHWGDGATETIRPDGDWVLFEDHERLLTAMQAERDTARAERDTARAERDAMLAARKRGGGE